MKPGDLVTMRNYCGGNPGSIRCDSALVLNVWLSHHEEVETEFGVRHDKEIYECSLMCKCGTFEEYEDNLRPINESR